MNKIISRMLVLGLLVSFVQAQAPSKNIDKEAHKATKDVREEAKDKANKTVSGQDAARIQDLEGSDVQSSATKGSAKKGAKGVTKGSPNMAPSARVSGDRQLSGTRNTSASTSGKKARKGAFSRVFSRIFGGGEKVDGASAGKGKEGAAQPASDGQDRPSGGQGYQQPKGDKGAAGPKPQDDGGGR